MVSLSVQGSNPAWYHAATLRQYGCSIRAIAYNINSTVGDIHAMFGCRDGYNCKGGGCHVPPKERNVAGYRARD